jgi:hypothetical protein
VLAPSWQSASYPAYDRPRGSSWMSDRAPGAGRCGCRAAWTGVVSARDACFARGKRCGR